MTTRKLAFIVAIAIAAAPAAAIAQNTAPASPQQNLTINGVAVPDDQMEAVRAKCDTLLGTATTGAAGATGGMTTPGTAPATPSAGATSGNPTAPTGATAGVGTPTQDNAPGTGAVTGSPAPQAGGDQQAQIDIESLSADQCRAGGFGPEAPAR